MAFIVDPKHAKRICEGKRSYPDQVSAMAFGQEDRDGAGALLYCYRCARCSRWHLTKHAVGPDGRRNIACRFEDVASDFDAL